MTMPDPGRQAAHILLDSVIAFDDELGEHPDNGDAMNLALARLQEVNAVKATTDDNDVLDLNISDLVGGAMVTMKRLAHLAAAARGDSVEDVVAETRHFLDNPVD